ncbi:MAG: 50S ribosomal protein L18 [Phycisphaerae bacterium]|nr:50S ribosomal protein L18 [Phycisphaerae bacterium]
MKADKLKAVRRRRRKVRVRKLIFGDTGCPRLTVTRSLLHISAQIIDDEQGVTLCQASSMNKDLRDSVEYGGNVAAAKIVGAALAERGKSKGVEAVRFDRNGYRFHGRIKALADAAREGGLKF